LGEHQRISIDCDRRSLSEEMPFEAMRPEVPLDLPFPRAFPSTPESPKHVIGGVWWRHNVLHLRQFVFRVLPEDDIVGTRVRFGPDRDGFGWADRLRQGGTSPVPCQEAIHDSLPH
jgi:hypothetical protein